RAPQGAARDPQGGRSAGCPPDRDHAPVRGASDRFASTRRCRGGRRGPSLTPRSIMSADDRDDEDDLELETASEPEGEADAGDLPEVSRKTRRRRRRTRPRSKTIAMKRLPREELRIGALMSPPVDIPRPETRAECREEMRPCPWVAGQHHPHFATNPQNGSHK